MIRDRDRQTAQVQAANNALRSAVNNALRAALMALATQLEALQAQVSACLRAARGRGSGVSTR